MDFADLMALDLIDMAEKSLQKIEKAVGNRPAEVAVNPQDITDMKEAMINLTLLLTQLDKKVEDLTEMVKSSHKVVAYDEPIPDKVDLTALNRLEEVYQINKTEEKKPSTRKKQDKMGSKEKKRTFPVYSEDSAFDSIITSSYMLIKLIEKAQPNEYRMKHYEKKLEDLDVRITNEGLKVVNNLIEYIRGDIKNFGVFVVSDGRVYITQSQYGSYSDAMGDNIRVRDVYKSSIQEPRFSVSHDWVEDLEPLLVQNIETLRNFRKNNKPKNRADESLIIPAASKPTVNVVQKGGHVEDVYTLDESTRLHIARNTMPYDDDLRFYKDRNDNILCSIDLINLDEGGLIRTDIRPGYDVEDAEGEVLEYHQRERGSYRINNQVILMDVVYLQPNKRITYISSILSTNDTTWINNKRKELTEDLMELEEEEDEYKGFDVYFYQTGNGNFYQSMDDYIMCCYTDNPPSCVILTDLMVDKEFDSQGWYKCLSQQEDRYIYVYQIATASPQFSTDRSVKIPLFLSDPKKQDILKNVYPGTARAVKGITKSWLKRTRGTKSIKKFKRDELWN